jgi:hypothetical protein
MASSSGSSQTEMVLIRSIAQAIGPDLTLPTQYEAYHSGLYQAQFTSGRQPSPFL